MVSIRVQRFLNIHTTPITCSSQECPICLEPYTGSEPAVRIINILGCQHIFGRTCLIDFLSNQPSASKKCPLCRTEWIPAENSSIHRQVDRGLWEIEAQSYNDYANAIQDIRRRANSTGYPSRNPRYPAAPWHETELAERDAILETPVVRPNPNSSPESESRVSVTTTEELFTESTRAIELIRARARTGRHAHNTLGYLVPWSAYSNSLLEAIGFDSTSSFREGLSTSRLRPVPSHDMAQPSNSASNNINSVTEQSYRNLRNDIENIRARAAETGPSTGNRIWKRNLSRRNNISREAVPPHVSQAAELNNNREYGLLTVENDRDELRPATPWLQNTASQTSTGREMPIGVALSGAEDSEAFQSEENRRSRRNHELGWSRMQLTAQGQEANIQREGVSRFQEQRERELQHHQNQLNAQERELQRRQDQFDARMRHREQLVVQRERALELREKCIKDKEKRLKDRTEGV